MIGRFAVVIVACVVASGAQAQISTPDLDTRFLPRPAPTDASAGQVATLTFARDKSAVAVRLLAIEPSSCVWDEAIWYDLEVRNIGQEPVTLPWSLIPPVAPVSSDSPTTFPIVTVSLRVGDNLKGWLGLVETLYGNPADSFTVRQLAPQAAVVIRVETQCRFSNSGATKLISPSGSTTVKVFATARFLRNASTVSASIDSNEMAVTVSRPN